MMSEVLLYSILSRFMLSISFSVLHWKNITQIWQRKTSTWKDVIARYKDDITFSRRYVLFQLFFRKRHAERGYLFWNNVVICEIKRVCRILYLGSCWIEIEFSTDKTVPLFKNVKCSWIDSSQLLKTEWKFNRVNSHQLKFMIILVNHTWEFYKTKIQDKNYK